MAKGKSKSRIVGNLWKDVSDAQKAAGVVLTGHLDGLGRVTVFKRKEKRAGKKDSDFYVTADLPEGSAAAPEEVDEDTPF
jgi:hypothetical protein